MNFARYPGRAAAALNAAALSGCSAAPSQNIFGSYFPSWMLCAIAGLIVAVAAQRILAALNIDPLLPARPLVYLALATAFGFAMWLLWLS